MKEKKQKKFIEPSEQLLEAIKNTQDILKPITNSQGKWEKALTPIISEQQKFQETFKTIAKQAGQWKRAMEKVYEAGWWFSPSMTEITLEQIQENATRYTSGNKRAITQMFFSIYQKENCKYLGSTAQGWRQNPYFKRWRKVIDEALDSHIYKKYSVSTPALLLTAEGIATDYCKKKNIFNKTIKSTGNLKIKTALEQTSNKKREFLLTDFFVQLLFSIIDNKIFEKTDKLDSSITRGYEHFLNRHAIMHGASSKYGSLKNSLQCFLILDVLSLLS